MVKNQRIELRISSKQKDFIKLLDVTYSFVWQLGFDELVAKSPKMIEKMYVQNKIGQDRAENNVRTLFTQLDDLIVKAVKNNRDLDNPDLQDVSWIDANLEGTGVTSNYFFKYYKERKHESVLSLS